MAKRIQSFVCFIYRFESLMFHNLDAKIQKYFKKTQKLDKKVHI